ncbi:MAG: glucose-6-phosphate isomerase [Gammaproteobacteria bacterium]|nr:glucose-6-phosphate isomerase [Gammaproteobacteria bacterium]
MNKITQSAAWQKLNKHQQQMAKVAMRDLFNDDPERFSKYSLEAADLFLDYSKNRITQETFDLLCELPDNRDLASHIEAMFSGQIINTTEQRAVLHTALRNPDETSKPEVLETRNKMLASAEAIRHGKWKGFSGLAITDVVNIGIGGSDLGPAMVTQALKPYQAGNIKLHFVSNVDGTHIWETLKELNPATTLFIIASKTFTTQETLCNANTAKEWLEQKAQTANASEQHLIAVTAQPERAQEFGIKTEHIYPFWDWVGGRYSLWSAIGLAIAIAIGADKFREFLAGAHAMDDHFRHAPWNQNMPVILALLGIWNSNFFNHKTQVVLPYDQYLELLPAYLQQLDMESNGKRVDVDGSPLDTSTAPIIWGSVGTNGQHAFHQLLLQGTQKAPADFIMPLNSQNPIGQHHMLLFANCLAQSQAMMQGKTEAEATEELLSQGMAAEAAAQLAPHKVIPGNVPNNTILVNKITPATLGALIALYEHKVFVQGTIWGINPFDQWGVELGKQLAKNIIPGLQDSVKSKQFDSSTCGLIKKYFQNN